MKVVEDYEDTNGSSFDEEIYLLDKDINKLQVNGRSTRKTRKKSYESSHDSAPTSPRQGRKCGRPSNPIPRHKRDSHIKAEHKRRDKIQKGFDCLRELVPSLEECSPKESKSSMLLKTAEHCRQLKAECKTRQDEASVLRQEIEALGSQIHMIQSKLPASGMVKVEKTPSSIDDMYQEYVYENTKKNTKFWIFSFIMDPIFRAYKKMTDKCCHDAFFRMVQQWAEDNLSLVNLRPGVLSALRDISKKTSIMDKPENIAQDALNQISKKSLPSSPVISLQCTPVSSPKESDTYHLSPVHLPQQVSLPVQSNPVVTTQGAVEPLQDIIDSIGIDCWPLSENMVISTLFSSESGHSMTCQEAITSQATDMEIQTSCSLPMLDIQTTHALSSELEVSDSLLDSLTSQVDMQPLPDIGHILPENLSSALTTVQSTDSDLITVWSQSHSPCVSSTKQKCL